MTGDTPFPRYISFVPIVGSWAICRLSVFRAVGRDLRASRVCFVISGIALCTQNKKTRLARRFDFAQGPRRAEGGRLALPSDLNGT